MENLYIEATKESPLVSFDLERKQFVMKGCSVMQDVNDFYDGLIAHISLLPKSNIGELNFVFDLDYFNIASSKRILFILYRLVELKGSFNEIIVTWCFKNNDDDMKEVGEDFAFMINLPFNFVGYNEGEIPEINTVKLV